MTPNNILKMLANKFGERWKTEMWQTLKQQERTEIPGSYHDVRKAIAQADENFVFFKKLTAIFNGLTMSGANTAQMKHNTNVVVMAFTIGLKWSLRKEIYQFHPVLFEELIKSEHGGSIPSSIFNFIPSPCIFIQVPPNDVLFKKFEPTGFFAFVGNYTFPGGQTEKCLFICPSVEWTKSSVETDDIHTAAIPDTYILPIGENRTIEDSVRYFFDLHPTIDPKDYVYIDDWAKRIKRIITLILYLLSQEADIEGQGAKPKRPPSMASKLVKNQDSRFPEAVKPYFYKVGEKVSQQIEKSNKFKAGEENDSLEIRNSPSPHLRKGHWHHYWTGPRNPESSGLAERKLILKWLPPMMVATEK